VSLVYRTVQSDIDLERVVTAVENVCHEVALCALATVDGIGCPTICNTWFAPVGDMRFAIFADPQTTHGRNLREVSNSASLAVASTDQSWDGALRGVWIRGRCRPAKGAELDACFNAYATRFPEFLSLASQPVGLTSVTPSRLFIFVADEFKILDETAFGRRNYVAASIDR
jgi:uncharacterized protein YhbP (UPF0306 family)